MGTAAILDKWSGSFEQTLVPPSQGGSFWNLTMTGSEVSEKKTFEEWPVLDTQSFRPVAQKLNLGH